MGLDPGHTVRQARVIAADAVILTDTGGLRCNALHPVLPKAAVRWPRWRGTRMWSALRCCCCHTCWCYLSLIAHNL